MFYDYESPIKPNWGIPMDNRLKNFYDEFRENLQPTMKKYRVIYIGYIVSMLVIVASFYMEFFNPPSWLDVIKSYPYNTIIYATVVFAMFMLVHFVREGERLKYELKVEDTQRIKEGIWIAEQEIRNQIILINQATHIAQKKGELNGQMINIIRDNTSRMEKHLEILQQEDIDPRSYRGILAPLEKDLLNPEKRDTKLKDTTIT